MNDHALGRLFRAVRIQLRWWQEDVSAVAGVSRSLVSVAERGHLEWLRLSAIRAIGGTLEIRLPFGPSYRCAVLERVANAVHTAIHERAAELLATLPGWGFVSEATFSIFGEGGSIDLLAWHAATRSLLVGELQ